MGKTASVYSSSKIKLSTSLSFLLIPSRVKSSRMERLTGASAKTYNIKDSTTVCQKCNDYVFNQFFVYNSDNKWTERKKRKTYCFSCYLLACWEIFLWLNFFHNVIRDTNFSDKTKLSSVAKNSKEKIRKTLDFLLIKRPPTTFLNKGPIVKLRFSNPSNIYWIHFSSI